MTEQSGLSRRRLLGAAAGTAGAVALGGYVSLSPASGAGRGARLVPPGKLGVQQWAIRDSITRLDKSMQGFLGGPNFPEDPTDLGPLVDLPGGFAAVFEYLASVGYKTFEFFSYSQGANGAITPQQIRTALDNAGLRAVGSHTGGLATMRDPVQRAQQIEIAHTLGLKMIGTAGDPVTGAAANLLANWQTAAQDYNTIGAALRDEGLRYYLHPEQNNFNFFNDPAHPELSRVHRIDWFTEHTDPKLVFFEPDVLHAYAGRARFPDPVTGELWDILGWLEDNWKRIIAWHVKDGSRISPPPAAGVNPFTQNVTRTLANGTTFTDAIAVGEGSIGQGYPVDPDPVVIGFKKLFQLLRARGMRYYFAESDAGPGPATGAGADPGRSLRWAEASAHYLRSLRAGSKGKGKGQGKGKRPAAV